MKGRTTSRRQGSRWNRYILVTLSLLYLLHTSFFYSYVSIGIGGTEQSGSTAGYLSRASFGYDKSNQDFCENMNTSSTNPNTIIEKSVFRHWKFIDETIERKFPKARVSGGIFLYPRQASILTHLVKSIHAGFGDYRKTITICETGYGSGHSMALFREASASFGPVRVISFDKFDRQYQLPIWHYFNKTFSASQFDNSNGTKTKKSFDFVKGDSCKTVPNLLPSFQCDILHGSSLCPTDNIDLVENSPCGVLLTSTAMNSLNDRQVYFGPRAQWRKLRERKCISNIVCFKEDGKLDLKRDFVFAKQGSTQTGEFCVAVTTGRCRRGKADSRTISEKCIGDINQLLIQLDLDKTCSQYQIEPPS